MTQPHHHVFNALQRSIIRSCPIQPLLPLLVKKGVVKEEKVEMFDSKANGMKILTSYLRIQDFATFLKFVECLCELEKSEESFKKMEFAIVDSILSAVEDFDVKHPEMAGYAKEVDKIVQQWREPALLSIGSQGLEVERSDLPKGSVGTVYSDSDGAEMDRAEVAELAMPACISEPVTVTFTSKSHYYYNSELDFSISLPEGSICEGEPIQFKIGACFEGPFAIPDRYMLVTDIFCVVARGGLSKDTFATVNMYHCLQMPVYQRHNGLFILRADHRRVTKSGLFIFERLTNPEVASDQPHLSFKIKDFCLLCGAYEQQPCSDAPSSESPYSRQSSLDDEAVLDRSYSVGSDAGAELSRTCSTESDTGACVEPSSQADTHSRLHSKRSSRRRQQAPYSRVQMREPKSAPEYAIILFEPINPEKTSSKWPLFIFVCVYCPLIMRESKKQAQELMKRAGFDNNVEDNIIQVTIEEDIEFIPVSEGTGWKVTPKCSPAVIKQGQVNEPSLMRSMGSKKLGKMVEEHYYPVRMKFTVKQDKWSALSVGAQAKIIIHGVQRNDGDEHSFDVELPTMHVTEPVQAKSLNDYLDRIPDGLHNAKVKKKHVNHIVLHIKSPLQTGKCLNLPKPTVERLCYSPQDTSIDYAYNIIVKGWFQQTEKEDRTYKNLVIALHLAKEYDAIEEVLWQLQQV